MKKSIIVRGCAGIVGLAMLLCLLPPLTWSVMGVQYDTHCNVCGHDNPQWLEEDSVHYCENCGALGMPAIIEDKRRRNRLVLQGVHMTRRLTDPMGKRRSRQPWSLVVLRRWRRWRSRWHGQRGRRERGHRVPNPHPFRRSYMGGLYRPIRDDTPNLISKDLPGISCNFPRTRWRSRREWRRWLTSGS